MKWLSLATEVQKSGGLPMSDGIFFVNIVV